MRTLTKQEWDAKVASGEIALSDGMDFVRRRMDMVVESAPKPLPAPPPKPEPPPPPAPVMDCGAIERGVERVAASMDVAGKAAALLAKAAESLRDAVSAERTMSVTVSNPAPRRMRMKVARDDRDLISELVITSED